MRYFRLSIFGLLTLLSTGGLSAEVKTEEKHQVSFEGMMGRVVGMFGGKALKEGAVSRVAVKENRKMTLDDYTGQIIDLDEEKVYDLDMRKKTYRVTSFAELQRRMREAEAKAAEQAKKDPRKTPDQQKTTGAQPEFEIDFTVKESGQKRVINGFDCREVVMTITAHEKGKTLEQGGGVALTSNLWLTPEIRAMKEIREFDQRYARKIAQPFVLRGSTEGMAAALAMYPGLKQALGKFQVENVNMDGSPVLTAMKMEVLNSKDQLAAKQRSQSEEALDVSSIGGLLGGLGKKMARKKIEESEPPSDRATILTMNNELFKVSTTVNAADISIPEGFKEKQ